LEEIAMFCVECGKEGHLYKKGVCVKCYVNTTTFTHGPELINLIQCSKCGVFKYKNTWTKQIPHNMILRILKDTFKILPELQNIQYALECEPPKSQYLCIVTISGDIHDHPVSESHQLQIRVSNIVCDVCSKQYGGYYEGILQIRADDRKLTPDEHQNITDIIEQIVQMQHSKGNRQLFITDIAEEHGGLDFYLSERGSAYTLAKKIQNTHGGELKQSSSLVGIKEGRELTRITVLLRLPSYQKHDFIRIDTDYYHVRRLTGHKIYLINLSNWEETTLETKDLKRFHIYHSKDYLKEMILVSQTHKSIQLMDPKTYKLFELDKPQPIDISNKTVTVFQKDDVILLVPNKTQ
jgi:nonsense-mediated mRNA decay protein 3